MGNAALAAHIADLDLGHSFKAMAHRDLALKVLEDKFNQIMPCVFADHINAQFDADGLDPMRMFQETHLFAEAYKDLVIDPKFNPFGSRSDLHFDMTFLFPRWGYGSAPTVKGLSASQSALLIASYLPSATYSPTGKANATIQDYAIAMLNASLVPPGTVTAPKMPQEDIEVMITTKTIFDGADVSYYYAISHTLWNQWMITINDNSTSNFWVIDLVSWYHANEKAAFLKSNVSFNNVSVTHVDGLSGSCFVSGTLVETSNGPVAIETLRENDVILTRTGAQNQWGLYGDEIVESAAPKTLYGFDGGRAFFTARHPFHTTTGIPRSKGSGATETKPSPRLAAAQSAD
ncbi:uncharacterized protein NECHADRAFT_88667 [Fusarium vanettenii 77-13-4]|uniref:Uncharacterized protein n=1 Tax=Fusarium vanettenii (strain ATCC MYA-4622 / CBS 123669 / FGSC 9596 / NRRL 45880 / 77-13-4) TaxID=660122 RepID=C7ZLG3_FUSV7|nr:uncharacterized protein NECHADRAFT_88667 [Fusarium vanettenii 77-13-4]EEU35111.1 predicted protein [Fusarium vanettenii 77-13-4]